jgi:hypothetical protein
MNPLVAETVEALRGAGWTVELASPPLPLPAHIVERYPEVPPLAVEFFTGLLRCEAPGGGWWLLTAADFAAPADPDGHAWDSFEEISHADTDPDARAWWDRHLILLQLVNGDFQFLALCLDRDSPNFGKVVGGDLLDFDAAEPLADSYEEFLCKLRDIARAEPVRALVYREYLALFVHETIIEDGSVPPWEQGAMAKLKRWLGRK